MEAGSRELADKEVRQEQNIYTYNIYGLDLREEEYLTQPEEIFTLVCWL